MKTLTTLNSINSKLAAILACVSLSDTSASLSEPDFTSAMAVKTKKPIVKKGTKGKPAPAEKRRIKVSDVKPYLMENVGHARADGRIKFPKRMFTDCDRTEIQIGDEVEVHQLDSDNGRSNFIQLSALGAEPGDDIEFTYVGRGRWDYEITPGNRRRKSSKKPAVAKPVVKKSATKPAKPTASPVKRTAEKPVGKAVKQGVNIKETLKDAAKKFGKLARKNYKDGFENENIEDEDDPRHYLTSRENAQARKIWKKQAKISLAEWVKLLDAEVFG